MPDLPAFGKIEPRLNAIVKIMVCRARKTEYRRGLGQITLEFPFGALAVARVDFGDLAICLARDAAHLVVKKPRQCVQFSKLGVDVGNRQCLDITEENPPNFVGFYPQGQLPPYLCIAFAARHLLQSVSAINLPV